MTADLWIAGALATIAIGCYWLGYLHGYDNGWLKAFREYTEKLYSGIMAEYTDGEEIPNTDHIGDTNKMVKEQNDENK